MKIEIVKEIIIVNCSYGKCKHRVKGVDGYFCQKDKFYSPNKSMGLCNLNDSESRINWKCKYGYLSCKDYCNNYFGCQEV